MLHKYSQVRIKRSRRNRIIEKLSKISDDVWYIKAESSQIYHIAINEETFCSTKLTAYWKRTITETDYICPQCIWKTEYLLKSHREKIEDQFNYRTRDSNIHIVYGVSWRCTAIVINKGKCKKIKRCSNCSKGPYESFCTLHSKCFLKYINQYISVSQDVSKLIYNLL
jgi:hypothetical protein